MTAAADRQEQPDAPDVSRVIGEELRPLVRKIDEEGLYPAGVMRSLGDAGAFAHHVTKAEATSGDLLAAIEAMAEVGATCISTAFCTWCQDALVWYIDRSENPAPRERYLNAAAGGQLLGGTGLSNPMKALAGFEPLALKGVQVEGGYRVTGRLPFVSNLEDGHFFASVFSVDNQDRKVMALFKAGAEGVALARNAHFIALEGTATYSVLIRDAFIAESDVLSEDATTFIPKIRKGFVLLQMGMGLGAARGAAAAMRADSSGRRLAAHLPLGPDEIDARSDALLERIRDHARGAQETDRAAFLDILKLRLDASWLALEAAQSAVLQFGARGYLAGSETSRRLREAQFVGIVTPSVKHILAELAKA